MSSEVARCVVKQNIWNMCLLHILCRDHNMVLVAETPGFGLQASN